MDMGIDSKSAGIKTGETPCCLPWLIIAVFLYIFQPHLAEAANDRLTIVTSYSEEIYTSILSQFKKGQPNIKVKVINKKTTAAISYVQEMK